MKFLNKGIFLLFVIIFSISFSGESFSFKNFEFATVSDIVKNIKKRFSELESYQADFKIVAERFGKKEYKNGRIRYKASNMMLLEFQNPHGQKIISDGKTMWIYIPTMNVVAEQDLKSDSPTIFSTGTKSGLKRLFTKYHYKFASKTQPEKQTDGSMQYTLFLKQRESRSGFRTIKLWVSEDYFITKVYGESSTGKAVEINFNSIKTNVILSNGIFKFDIPSKARIIKNPMISEE